MHAEAVIFVYTSGVEERSADKPDSGSIHDEHPTIEHAPLARLGGHRKYHRLPTG